MADQKLQEQAEVDPRKALAERYLQRARADLAAKEAEKRPPAHRADEFNAAVRLGDLWPRLSGSTFIHLILLMPVTALAAVAMVWCFVLLEFHLVVGRVIVMPAGILLILAVSYATAYYLGVIESTSHGETNPDEALRGSWQDWFWLLPATVGVFAMAVGISYIISVPFEGARWTVLGMGVLLLYPLMQLSSLETGSPFAPFSGPIVLTLFTRPIMWAAIYAATFGIAMLLAAAGNMFWRDPPYFTMVIMSPLLVVALLAYGLVLGTAARWLSLRGR